MVQKPHSELGLAPTSSANYLPVLLGKLPPRPGPQFTYRLKEERVSSSETLEAPSVSNLSAVHCVVFAVGVVVPNQRAGTGCSHDDQGT